VNAVRYVCWHCGAEAYNEKTIIKHARVCVRADATGFTAKRQYIRVWEQVVVVGEG
jgi:uncharacterized Fe-S cluster protein YjdI